MGDESLKDEPDSALTALFEALSRHPIAAQALFAALVAEGRAYARTAEGAELRRRLERSDLALRMRAVWDVLTAGSLVEDADVVLPSAVVEAIARAAMQARPELVAARAIEGVSRE